MVNKCVYLYQYKTFVNNSIHQLLITCGKMVETRRDKKWIINLQIQEKHISQRLV